MRERLIKNLQDVHNSIGKIPSRAEAIKYGMFKASSYEEHFGTYTEAKKAAFGKDIPRVKGATPPTRQELLDELLLIYRVTGDIPTRSRVRKLTKFSTSVYDREFGSFSAAIKEAMFISPELKVYNDFWRLSGDYIIISDVHCPYFHGDAFNKLIAMTQKFKIKNIIIAGDFFNQDAFSHYQNAHDISFNEELQIATDLLDKLCQTFSNIYILTGNHDLRILKALSHKLNYHDFWKMVTGKLDKQIFVSEYPYLRLLDRKGEEKMHVTHPRNFSTLPTRVARNLNHKYQMGVAVAHGHAMGVSYSPSGRDVLIDTGFMGDPTKVEYVCLNDTTHSRWTVGFSVWYNGYVYQFPYKHTDWDFWLKTFKGV
jgi:predicted phosphodiesterase